MAVSPIARYAGLFLAITLALPPSTAALFSANPTSLASSGAQLGSAVVGGGSSPTAAGALPALPQNLSPIDQRILDAYRVGELRPNVRSLFEYYAQEHGYVIPPPVERNTTAAMLPDAVKLFVATFDPSAMNSSDVQSLLADAPNLPPDLASTLARVLFATVDAQALDESAYAPLTNRQIQGLAAGTLPPDQLALAASHANIPLALQAAETLELNAQDSQPVLRKWGYILELRDIAYGRPLASAPIAASLPSLARSLDKNGAPALLGWDEALLAHTDLLNASTTPRSNADMVQAIALYYAAMHVPLNLQNVAALSAMRGADPRIQRVVADNLVAGAAAWTFTLPTTGTASQELLAMAPELARIEQENGVTDADLATLAQAVNLEQQAQAPGALEALTVLLDAAQETQGLAHEQMAIARPSLVNSATCVGGASGLCWSILQPANGSTAVQLNISGTSHTFWSTAYEGNSPLKADWNDTSCSLLIWQDTQDNGRPQGYGTNSGNIVFQSSPTCDTTNNVVFQDPFGYILVTGTGNSVLDARYGNVYQYVASDDGERSGVWAAFNTTLDGSNNVQLPCEQSPEQLPFTISLGGPSGQCTFFGLPTTVIGGQGIPGIAPLLCFGPAAILAQFQRSLPSLPQTPFTGNGGGGSFLCQTSTIGNALFGSVPGSNVTVNPDSYQILTIDLGGNTTYLSNAGGTYNSTLYDQKITYDNNGVPHETPYFRSPFDKYGQSRERVPIAIAIDLGGNDTYSNARSFVQGAADLGVAFLYRHGGSATFHAGDYAVAAANTPDTAGAQSGGGGFGGPASASWTHAAALAAVIAINSTMNVYAGNHSLAFANRTATAVFANIGGNATYDSANESQAYANGTIPLAACGITDSNVAGAPTEYPPICLAGTTSGDLANAFSNVQSASSATFLYPAAGQALFVQGDGTVQYTIRAKHSQGEATYDHAQGRAINGGLALLLDLGGNDTGLASNGDVSVDNTLGIGLSTRRMFNQLNPLNNQETDRYGAQGFGMAVDVDTPLGSPLATDNGFYYQAPGATAQTGEDPLAALDFYVTLPGALAIGSESDKIWTKDYTVAIDLGGNDIFDNHAGAATVNTAPLGDYYGAGSTGMVGEFNPSLSGPANGFTQTNHSTSPIGQTTLVALTLVAGGKDTYNVASNGAGYAQLGIGVLLTGGGDDTMNLGLRTGGVGTQLGIGMLIQRGGNDTIRALPRTPASDSLGYGESGGIGLFLKAPDRRGVYGNDSFAAKNWSLGSMLESSSYEAGIFFSGGGNDRYQAPPNGQGVFNELNGYPSEQPAFPIPGGPANSTWNTAAASLANAYVASTGLALFVKDGWGTDTFLPYPSNCLWLQTNRSCHENNASWTQDGGQYNQSYNLGSACGPEGTVNPETYLAIQCPGHAGERAKGLGIDNVNAYLNAQFLAVTDPSPGQTGDLNLTKNQTEQNHNRVSGNIWVNYSVPVPGIDIMNPTGPDVLAVRGILLSPSVSFTYPETAGTQFDNEPYGSVHGTQMVRVVATAGDPEAIAFNVRDLAEMLVMQEADRYSCDQFDSTATPGYFLSTVGGNVLYSAPANTAASLEQGQAPNPDGGFTKGTPFYCSEVNSTLASAWNGSTRATLNSTERTAGSNLSSAQTIAQGAGAAADAPATSALGLLLPVLAEALQVSAPTATPPIPQAAVNAMDMSLAHAAALAASGDTPDALALLNTLPSALKPMTTASPAAAPTAPTPTAPSPPCLTTCPRFPGSQNVNRTDWYLGGSLVAECKLSGANMTTFGCKYNATTDPNWFTITMINASAAASTPCNSTSIDEGIYNSQWGCYNLFWHTAAVNHQGRAVFPNGRWMLSVKAYYAQQSVTSGTPAAGTPVAAQEPTADRLVSDNYGNYPGSDERLFALQNAPIAYLNSSATVIWDFVPGQPWSGATIPVSEPVQWVATVQIPGTPGFQKMLSGVSRVLTPNEATAPSDFYPLTQYNECAQSNRVDRDYSCTPPSAQTISAIYLAPGWQPESPVAGMYVVKISLWDGSPGHAPDTSPTQNVQANFTFTFLGDAHSPVAAFNNTFHNGFANLSMIQADPPKASGLLTGSITFTLAGDEGVPGVALAPDCSHSVTYSCIDSIQYRGSYTSANGSVHVVPVTSVPRVNGRITFQLRLLPGDNGGFHGTTWSILVAATTHAGVTQPWANATRLQFKVDMQPPIAEILGVPEKIGNHTVVNATWNAQNDAPWGADTASVVVQYQIQPNTVRTPDPQAWLQLPETFVQFATPTAPHSFIFSPVALGMGPTVAVEPNVAWVRLVLTDNAGNPAPTIADPMTFDTLPPVVESPSWNANVSAATVNWHFDEAAIPSTVSLRFADMGARNASTNCSQPGTNQVFSIAAQVTTSDRGTTWRGVVGQLKSNWVYDMEILGNDTVGNAITPGASGYVYRICTTPILEATVTEPSQGDYVSGISTISWTTSHVQTGTSALTLPIVYTVVIQEGAKNQTVASVATTDVVGYSISHSVNDFNSRLLPDYKGARVILYAQQGTGGRGVPLEFDGAPFTLVNTPPTTNATFGTSSQGVENWFPGPVTLFLNATSPGGLAPLAGTFISSDNRTFTQADCPMLKTASACEAFVTQGQRTVYYYSVDIAKNQEPTRSITFGIDVNPPQVSLLLAGGATAVRSSTVIAEIDTNDSLSGVNNVTMTTGPAGTTTVFGSDRLGFGALVFSLDLPAGQGARWVDVVARDRAGNIAEDNHTVRVDRTPPTVFSAFDRTGYTDALLRIETGKPTTASVLVKRSTDIGYQSRFVDSALSNVHTIDLTDLLPGTTYDAVIQVTDAIGNTNSAIASTKTQVDDTPPTVVSNLVAKDSGQGYISLSWKAATDDVAVARYDVFRAEGTATPVFLGFADDTHYMDTNLTPGLTYGYQVRAEDAAGLLGAASSEVHARATTLPAFVAGSVTPTIGSVATTFRFSVIVKDADGRRPAFVHLILNSRVIEMHPDGTSTNVRAGVLYVVELQLPQSRLSGGPNVFHFEASDGTHLVRTPTDTIGPVVTELGGNQLSAQSAVGGIFAAVRGVPGVPVSIALLAVCGVALWFRRRQIA
ncbi:MAG: hypothetical protein ACYDDF_08360 [Thermoplasmatota archaeon]